MSADERAEALNTNTDIETEHAAIAREGATSAEDAMNTNLHFIAFVHSDGHLYELDGRKRKHLHSTTTALLYYCGRVCRLLLHV